MTDLKPCPFCGKAAEFLTNVSKDTYKDPNFGTSWDSWRASVTLRCSNDRCHAQMVKRTSQERTEDHAKLSVEWFKEDLAKPWNKRLTKAKATAKSPPKKTKEDSNEKVRASSRSSRKPSLRPGR